MVCEFKLKGYCFHPDRAGNDFIATNCAYGWLAQFIQQSQVKKDEELTEPVLDVKTESQESAEQEQL